MCCQTAVGVKADLAMIIKQRELAEGESNQKVGQVSVYALYTPRSFVAPTVADMDYAGTTDGFGWTR